MPNDTKCKICGEDAVYIGQRKGMLPARASFLFYQCQKCRYSFVSNFRTDYENLYDARYYNGFGADKLVNYFDEINDFDNTARNYEWRGIDKIRRHLFSDNIKWLDYGCGLGGLVKYARALSIDIVGFEQCKTGGGV